MNAVSTCRFARRAALILLLAVAAGPAAADPRLWDPDGMPVLQNHALAWDGAVAQNVDGQTLVVWSDLRTGSRDIYAQLLSEAGQPLWAAGGIRVTDHRAEQSSPAVCAVSDGWIVAWIDYRDEPHNDRGGDPWAQKLDGNGTRLWTTNDPDGVPVDQISTNTVTGSLRVVPDAASGAWIAWFGDMAGIQGVCLQRVSGAGQLAYTTPIGRNTMYLYNSIDACPDGYGGILVAWSYMVDYNNIDIRAQRFTAQGPVWNDDYVAACTRPNRQIDPRIAADGYGGCYVSWEDQGISGGGHTTIGAQHISNTGAVLWGTDGITVGDGPNYRSRCRVGLSLSGGTPDGCLLVWGDDRGYSNGGSGYYGQKLSPAGAALWEANGILVADSAVAWRQYEPVSDGAGGLIWTYEDYSGLDHDNWSPDISAVHVIADGSFGWNAEHVPVSYASQQQSQPAVSVLPSGYLVLFATEADTSRGLAVQKLDRTTGARLLGETGTAFLAAPQGYDGNALAVPVSGGRTAVVWAGWNGRYVTLDAAGQVAEPSWGRELTPGRDRGYYHMTSVAPDGSGGFFAAAEEGNDEEGHRTLIMHAGANDELLSDSAGNYVADPEWPSFHRNGHVIADGAGGCYVSYLGGDVVDWEHGLYVRRFNAECDPLWAEPVMLDSVPTWTDYGHQLVLQPDGSCFVIWQGDDSRGIRLARLDPGGSILWNIELRDTTDLVFYPKLVADGAGGAYCAWADSRHFENNWNYSVYLQHVNAQGQTQWAQNGMPVDSTFEPHLSPRLALAPTGELLIVWIDQTDPTDEQVRAQKFTPAGERLWDPNGVLVCGAPRGQFYPAMVSDGTGGLFAIWVDHRDYQSPGPVLFGTHLNSDGTAGPDAYWVSQRGGLIRAETEIVDSPLLVPGSEGTAIVLWTENLHQSEQQTVLQLYAQRIAAEGLAAEGPSQPLPARFALGANYPNPFNATTVIPFELPAASRVQLTIYDVLGREVAVLADAVLPAGRHTRRLGTNALASGIYFYRLEAGSFSQTRKMILLK